MGTRLRPSPAMVVAMAALFVSIGGVGYAAGVINTGDIRNGAVTAKKLHRGAVTSAKLKRNAVRTTKIADAAVTAPKLADSTVTNAKLGNNAVSSRILADHSVSARKLGPLLRRTNTVTVTDNSVQLVIASCMPGETAITGGGAFPADLSPAQASQLHVVDSFPAGRDGWAIRIVNTSGLDRQFVAMVICLPN